MSTLDTPELRWLYGQWDSGMDYPSAVGSGIVGDLAHRLSGGYHISIEDQPSTNYSVVRPDDKAPPGSWSRDRAAALDMSMSLADMIKCHARLKAVWANRASDPRAKYVNAFNGWDGQDGAGRYDYVSGAAGSSDDSHKWHTHLEVRRRYVRDMVAMRAIASILRGETVDQYLGKGAVMSDFAPEMMPPDRDWGQRKVGTAVADTWGILTNGRTPYDPDGAGVSEGVWLVDQMLKINAELLKISQQVGGLSQADRDAIHALTEAVTALNNRLASP